VIRATHGALYRKLGWTASQFRSVALSSRAVTLNFSATLPFGMNIAASNRRQAVRSAQSLGCRRSHCSGSTGAQVLRSRIGPAAARRLRIGHRDVGEHRQGAGGMDD
jgi:hypothetical protein